MLNDIASRYILLVLAVGRHDADYVDAFYGPAGYKEDAERRAMTLEEIRTEAANTLSASEKLPTTDGLTARRSTFLHRQLEALAARVEMLLGRKYSFDEESQALYDAVAPVHTEAYFQKALDALSALLPGTGSVPDRLNAFRRDFVVPSVRLNDVFKAAVLESRRRTLQHIDLPAQESFSIEYVTGKSWSGYNWYQGSCNSLIQINTEFPIYIDRAIDLASHEGYPGHHVYNSLLETELVRKSGWEEFTVYALFSPQSLIAEGTANYGIEVVFPIEERIAFERDVLFPLAGLDPTRAETYYRVFLLTQQLAYAGNEAARGYLDGTMTRNQAAEWLTAYALMPPDRAMQRTKFFDQYRSYVINYNLGQDIVKRYIESRVGLDGTVTKRWQEFAALLSTPYLPSELC